MSVAMRLDAQEDAARRKPRRSSVSGRLGRSPVPPATAGGSGREAQESHSQRRAQNCAASGQSGGPALGRGLRWRGAVEFITE